MLLSRDVPDAVALRAAGDEAVADVNFEAIRSDCWRKVEVHEEEEEDDDALELVPVLASVWDLEWPSALLLDLAFGFALEAASSLIAAFVFCATFRRVFKASVGF